MHKLKTVGFIVGAFLFIFASLSVWQVWAQDDGAANGNSTIYLPWLSMQDTQMQALDSSAVVSATGSLLKPGEDEGFVPTPIPTIPFPDWVKPVMPGEPLVIDTRPSQVDLEALAENYISPDTPYQASAEIYHVTDSKSSALLSNTIVIAKVRKIHPSRWNTPDGKRPINPYDWAHPSYILTLADLEVQEVLKGTVKPGEILTLFRNGGQVGEEWLTVESYLAELIDGETLFLYTDAIKADIPGNYWRVNERYTIDPFTDRATNPFETRVVADLRSEVGAAEERWRQDRAQQP